jgi:crossover junction endodeoxyribonuclease RuvC
MRILGVDPGLRVTCYGAVEVGDDGPRLIEAGIIAPATDGSLEQRLNELHREMCAVIAAVAPSVMVVEELYSAYRNPTTAVLMGHARGVICLAAGSNGIAVRHLVHSLVKRALVGSGGARKEQVKRMVMQQLRLVRRPEPDDVSDALALALAFSNIDRAERRFAALGLAAQR